MVSNISTGNIYGMYILKLYLASFLAFYLTYLLAFYLTLYLAFYLACVLAFYLTLYIFGSRHALLHPAFAILHCIPLATGSGSDVPPALDCDTSQVQACSTPALSIGLGSRFAPCGARDMVWIYGRGGAEMHLC